jgi:outer membrane protein insertion porin family
VGLRYSLFQTEIKIPNTGRRPYNDCSAPIDGFTPGTPGGPALSQFLNCLTNGEASLAVKESQGRLITSLVGATLIYNSLDDNRKPTQGWLAELRGDIAGLGGSARFGRVTGDIRYFHPLFDDVIATARVQGGHVMGFGGYRLRLSDHFNPGPSLVRGFAPSGFGPRDIALNSQNGSLGGTTYLGGSLEVQFPIFGLPREVGLRAAVFADAGILFNYAGSRTFNTTSGRARPGAPAYLNAGVPTAGCEATFVAPTFTQGNCITVRDKNVVRSSVGASLLWDSPLGPIRIDYAFALSRDKGALEFDPAGNLIRRIPGDRVQAFRFSGGGRF